jgi:acetate kinase
MPAFSFHASLIPFLVCEEHLEIDQVMTLLNKKSGLLGISEKSLDTRVLMKEYGSQSEKAYKLSTSAATQHDLASFVAFVVWKPPVRSAL